MQVVDLPLGQLRGAPWNPNRMDEGMLAKLKESVVRFGVVESLVVRRVKPSSGTIRRAYAARTG